MIHSVCVYLHDGSAWLLMYRNKKPHDVNHGKWIGVGGKMEKDETPLTCAIRETRVETGYELVPDALQLQGEVLFDSPLAETEKIWIYTAQVQKHDLPVCNEGTLAWVKEEDIFSLPMWDADRIFLKEVLAGIQQPFYYRARYDEAGRLTGLSKGDEG